MSLRFFTSALALLGVCTLLHAARPPDERLAAAREQYRLGELNAAVRLYQSLQGADNPENDAQGLYGEATCWNFRGSGRNVPRAISLYDTLIKKYPAHPLAPWSALDRARALTLGLVDNTDTDGTIRHYEEVWSQYPKTHAGQEAFVYICGLSTASFNKQKAKALLEKIDGFLAAYPQSPFQSILVGYQGNCYKMLDRPQDRLAAMIRSFDSREVDPSSPNSNNVLHYWNIAYTAEFEIGDFKVAREYYGRLLKEYPKDLRIFSVRRALERMDKIEAAIREGRPIPAELLAPAEEVSK